MATLDTYLDRTAADLTTAIGATPLPGVQTYVGLPSGGVDVLRMWYASAIDWCNEKLSKRDFVDSAGASANPPDSCVQGVYEFVRVLKDYHELPSTLTRKTKTGAREEERGEVPGTAGRISAAAIVAWPYLEPYCDPTLFASGGGA